MAGDLDVASVPGSGSSFVLVLPGPAGAEPNAVASGTSRAVAEEEVRLEERAVLRAIAAAPGRPTSSRPPGGGRTGRANAARPTLVRGHASPLGPNTDDGGPARGPRTRLRSIDGLAGRTQDRSPA
jgi:hypothetical protein